MIIVYYTDKDGKIKHHHLAPMQLTGEDLAVAVQKYNERKEHDRTAHIFDAPDDSLTAYLFSKAAERRKWDKDAVQGAINDIENALETVRGLL